MRPVIIGAGRGSRLGHLTDQVPKPLVPIRGRPMLEWILDALAEGGFSRRDVVFISGYRGDIIRARYPEFTYVDNHDWAKNNILLSLFCAREHLASGFVSTYADIVYSGQFVRNLVDSPHDRVLGCDTNWRARYANRTRHPETDAEKLRADGDRITEISRHIPSDSAHGEFIGVTKFTAEGACSLGDAFDTAARTFAGKSFREGRSFERAYLIDLFQHMLEAGADFRHVSLPGGYMEIDTLEDHASADHWWSLWP
ncbi:MAG: phosphocholine cytidylyltransferase family protein [Myxococcales bacterium]